MGDSWKEEVDGQVHKTGGSDWLVRKFVWVDMIESCLQ